MLGDLSAGLSAYLDTVEASLSGWQAFEREACATWLEQRHLPREAVEQLLAEAFLSALTTAARYDPTAAAALERLGL